ncbi:hypothetical protein Ancab_005386 [Ancistrocladus abbreviatus]
MPSSHHFKYPSPLLPFPILHHPHRSHRHLSLPLSVCLSSFICGLIVEAMDAFCFQDYNLKENTKPFPRSLKKLTNGLQAKSASFKSNRRVRKPLQDITNLLYPHSPSTPAPLAANLLASRRCFNDRAARKNNTYHPNLESELKKSESTSLRMNFR